MSLVAVRKRLSVIVHTGSNDLSCNAFEPSVHSIAYTSGVILGSVHVRPPYYIPCIQNGVLRGMEVETGVTEGLLLNFFSGTLKTPKMTRIARFLLPGHKVENELLDYCTFEALRYMDVGRMSTQRGL